jgi:hypothetical protein
MGYKVLQYCGAAVNNQSTGVLQLTAKNVLPLKPHYK